MPCLLKNLMKACWSVKRLNSVVCAKYLVEGCVAWVVARSDTLASSVCFWASEVSAVTCEPLAPDSIARKIHAAIKRAPAPTSTTIILFVLLLPMNILFGRL